MPQTAELPAYGKQHQAGTLKMLMIEEPVADQYQLIQSPVEVLVAPTPNLTTRE